MNCRILPVLALLVACADDPSAPSASSVSAVASRERSTSDIVASVGTVDDGSVTKVDVTLEDRLGEAFSVELVDGDHLMLIAGDRKDEIARAPLAAWVHYTAEVPLTDLGTIAFELRRSDGSIVHSTVAIPGAYEITSAPATVRTGDYAAIGMNPAATRELSGLSHIQCDGTDGSGLGSFYAAGDGTPGQARISKTEMPKDASSCDANLSISVGSFEGSYDPTLGNPANDHPLGQQERVTRVRYYP